MTYLLKIKPIFMKRSKIVLSVTTCLLAVAGPATAKRFETMTRWHVTTNSHCVVSPSITCQQLNSATITCTVALGTPIKHFKIYTQGAVGPKANCLNELKYTTSL